MEIGCRSQTARAGAEAEAVLRPPERAAVRQQAAVVLTAGFSSRNDLLASGLRRRDIARAVADGRLVRARRDHYVSPDTPTPLIDACRAGGVLSCVSLLRLLGAFVLDDDRLHVRVAQNAGRLNEEWTRTARVHWSDTPRRPGDGELADSLPQALSHAVRCQHPRAAIATIDSAIHLGLMEPSDVDVLFSGLPARYGRLRPLIDGRAEAGTETLMRLMLRGVAHSVEPQVRIAGVGRVDLLVDGWLVVECDSDAHHAGLAARLTDSRRDLALAALGYTILRPMAADIMWNPERVLAAVRGLLAHGPSRRPRPRR
ncbi:DUF559 domain-containing protein [Microbacterium radiodurans]|uniref:DUF559 domain-containing protein n=2 Tax=Microbacterium radiodurans TaxID=661398 RepID=A0A5J5IU31_9MICO|nr:DUF559 domain-containing protein [Microbacterium radiodurans]